MANPAELAGTFVVSVGERLRTPFLVFYSDERDYELRLDLNTHWRVRFQDTEACAFLSEDYRWRLRLSGGRRMPTHHLDVLSRLSGLTVDEARKDSDRALRIVFSDRRAERTHLTVSGERTRFTVDNPWHLRRCLDTSLEIAWRLWALDVDSPAGRHAAR